VSEFASAAEGHRRELLLHCYRMLGSLPDAEDAVQETLLRAWRYRDSLKEGAPLRPWLYRVATNACLDAIARDERRALLAAKAEADDGAAGRLEDIVFSPNGNWLLTGWPEANARRFGFIKRYAWEDWHDENA